MGMFPEIGPLDMEWPHSVSDVPYTSTSVLIYWFGLVGSVCRPCGGEWIIGVG